MTTREAEIRNFDKDNERRLGDSFLKHPLPKEDSPGSPAIFLFRHGQSEDNQNGLFSGCRNSPLTELGRKQALNLSEKLKDKKIGLGLHSSLSRSLETLNLALRQQKKIKKDCDDRIIERCYGDLEGQSKIELFLKDPELYAKYHRGYDDPPPKGESLKMVFERLLPFFKEIKERARREKINIALSAHGNSMRILRMFFEDLSLTEMLEIENPLAEDYASYKV